MVNHMVSIVVHELTAAIFASNVASSVTERLKLLHDDGLKFHGEIKIVSK